jgi:hypothetical protein
MSKKIKKYELQPLEHSDFNDSMPWLLLGHRNCNHSVTPMELMPHSKVLILKCHEASKTLIKVHG